MIACCAMGTKHIPCVAYGGQLMQWAILHQDSCPFQLSWNECWMDIVAGLQNRKTLLNYENISAKEEEETNGDEKQLLQWLMTRGQ